MCSIVTYTPLYNHFDLHTIIIQYGIERTHFFSFYSFIYLETNTVVNTPRLDRCLHRENPAWDFRCISMRLLFIKEISRRKTRGIKIIL